MMVDITLKIGDKEIRNFLMINKMINNSVDGV